MSLEQLVKDLAEQNKKLVARLEEKSKEMPKMEKMLDELADRNAYLSSRLDVFEVSSPDSSPEASPAPAPRRSPRRRSPRRKTPVAPAVPLTKETKIAKETHRKLRTRVQQRHHAIPPCDTYSWDTGDCRPNIPHQKETLSRR